MDVSAEAADVVVRESLQATEAAAKLTLEGVKNVAAASSGGHNSGMADRFHRKNAGL